MIVSYERDVRDEFTFTLSSRVVERVTHEQIEKEMLDTFVIFIDA